LIGLVRVAQLPSFSLEENHPQAEIRFNRESLSAWALWVWHVRNAAAIFAVLELPVS